MTIRRSWLALATVMLSFTTLFASTPSASSHTWNQLYTQRWAVNGVLGGRPQFFFTASVPTGDGKFRERVRNGFQQWNGLNQSLIFVEEPAWTWTPARSTCYENKYGIFVAIHDGKYGQGGLTGGCVYGNDKTRIYYKWTMFDSQESWWNETSAPTSAYADTWSVATHEAGHGGGAAHWDPAAGICTGSDGSPLHTMCPSITYGQSHWRSLELHDWHTLNDRY